MGRTVTPSFQDSASGERPQSIVVEAESLSSVVPKSVCDLGSLVGMMNRGIVGRNYCDLGAKEDKHLGPLERMRIREEAEYPAVSEEEKKTSRKKKEREKRRKPEGPRFNFLEDLENLQFGHDEFTLTSEESGKFE